MADADAMDGAPRGRLRLTSRRTASTVAGAAAVVIVGDDAEVVASALLGDEKKLRRNARDRSRTQLKKTTMEKMRQQVAHLEATKQQLEQRFASLRLTHEHVPAPAAAMAMAVTPRFDDRPLYEKYRVVLQQLEQLRHRNRAMALEVLQRDLFRSAAQNLLHARAKAVAPAAIEDDDDGEFSIAWPPPHPLPPRPLPTMPAEDAVEFARRVVRHVRTSRLESETTTMQRVTRARVFGWSDFRVRTDATIQFTIQKRFVNQSAEHLAHKSWGVMSDSTQLRHLLPRDVQCDLREVQRVHDHAIVFDRISTDRKFKRLQYTALRTTYMLVRAVDESGRCCIGMKTIDRPAFRAALADHEAWCDIFYWFHFEDVGVGSDDKAVAVVFGGALSYFTESVATMWLAELVFLAVRWEGKVVAPVLLRY